MPDPAPAPAPPPVPTPDTPPPAPPPAPPAPPAQPPAADTGKTYTQAEVDALDKKLQGAAAKAAEAKLLEGLGVGNADELKAILEAKRAQDEAAKSDVEKALEAAQARELAAATAIAESEATTLRANLTAALLASVPVEGGEPLPGLNPDNLSLILPAAIEAAAANPSDDPAVVLAETVAQIRAMGPGMFTGSTTAAPPAPPSPGTPGVTPAQTQKVASGQTDPAAAILAHLKRPDRAKMAPLPGTAPPQSQ